VRILPIFRLVEEYCLLFRGDKRRVRNRSTLVGFPAEAEEADLSRLRLEPLSTPPLPRSVWIHPTVPSELKVHPQLSVFWLCSVSRSANQPRRRRGGDARAHDRPAGAARMPHIEDKRREARQVHFPAPFRRDRPGRLAPRGGREHLEGLRSHGG
jgi:hypothetical protein